MKYDHEFLQRQRSLKVLLVLTCLLSEAQQFSSSEDEMWL